MELNNLLTSIKGIGDKTAEHFAKLNIRTVEQLLHYYPRTYISYERPVDIENVTIGCRQTVYATINSRPELRKVRGLSICTVYAKDYTGTIKLTWFNCPFLRNAFHIGQKYVFVGEISQKGNLLIMAQPEYYTQEKYELILSKWQPVYVCTSGITSKTIQKAVLNAKSAIDSLQDYLKDDIREQYNLMSINEAVFGAHFPTNEEDLKRAIKRLAFDEFYGFIAGMDTIKNQNSRDENEFPIEWDPLLTEFLEGLPYRLTNAQTNALRDIMEDLKGQTVMNRLVQGDVGSGKTIVCAAALFACAKAGFQGALMAPTEVLANQHFKDLTELFSPYQIRVCILCGSMTAKEKRITYDKIKNHEVDIVIGTHALIQEKVEYQNLALVVTDEQHRFGVRQRENLALKGKNPHVLVMSATPIPRTLAIIMYGDLDISVIDELPVGRKPIKNCVVNTSYRPTAHKFILGEVKKGHQVYIVCPMVEESETMDAENVIQYTDELKSLMPPEIEIEFLHGKLKGEEKNRILEDFTNKKIQILVSTTVIEVGINNPNATVMMVENAERFGLAQLHQLRGRVGRGNHQSYCIFVSGKKDKETMDRLSVLEDSNDGFYIASEDLKRRGPGDFFGIRQSGDLLFKIGDIYNHSDMLKAAQEIYKKFGHELKYKNSFGDSFTKTIL